MSNLNLSFNTFTQSSYFRKKIKCYLFFPTYTFIVLYGSDLFCSTSKTTTQLKKKPWSLPEFSILTWGLRHCLLRKLTLFFPQWTCEKNQQNSTMVEYAYSKCTLNIKFKFKKKKKEINLPKVYIFDFPIEMLHTF